MSYSDTLERPVRRSVDGALRPPARRPVSKRKAAAKARKRMMRKIKRFLIFDIALLLILMAVLQLNKAGFFEEMKFTMDKDKLEKQGVPEDIIHLYEKNPDTRDFVMSYSKESEMHHNTDISAEASSGGIPRFMQWDKRWGYETYGSNMMALTGCGPTCLSMVYTGLTKNADMNPLVIAERAEAEGYYVWGSGSSWDMMNSLAAEIGLTVHNVPFEESSIKNFLSEGHPIICVMGPGDFTESGHFIVLTGIDADGQIIVNDPNSYQNSDKHWDISTLMPQIQNLWGYSY